MLRFIGFRKSYGRINVLDVQDLVIAPGIYWLRGANGCGKSTLLKSIAGILHFEGDILLDGNSVRKNPTAYRTSVNFAEAEPVFPEFLTGTEMINLFAAAKHATAGQEIGFVQGINMQAYIDQPLGTYSSGMLKKLSLVLAFMGNPKIILLDEPLITLDQESLGILSAWIRETHQTAGTSFILASHQELEIDQIPWTNVISVENKTINIRK